MTRRPRSLRTLTFGSLRRTSSPGPPSPTFSETTHASVMNFGADGPAKIITRANLKASLQAYEDLMSACANYRAVLLAMSKATAQFADAMERCSGLKGPTYEAGTRLQAASGLHHLVGNLWHVLSETLDKSFEKPLRQHLETYRTIVQDRSTSYERALREKSQIIRDTELRSLNRKERNLQNFREALAVLQRQVDDLDELKVSHYQEIIEHEEEVWDVVQGKVSVAVRSTMDVFDRITAKASDPIIEPMLQSVPDPFDSYGPPQAEDQIFSILAPLSIMTNATSSSPSPMAGTPERDTTTPARTNSSITKITSWLPGTSVTSDLFTSESTAWASPHSPPARSTSPLSFPFNNSNGTSSHGRSNSTSPRRSSVPFAQRRMTDSKMKPALGVIEESARTLQDKENINRDKRASSSSPERQRTPRPSASRSSSPSTITGDTSVRVRPETNGQEQQQPAVDIQTHVQQPKVTNVQAQGQAHGRDFSPDLGWTFTYGRSPYEYDSLVSYYERDRPPREGLSLGSHDDREREDETTATISESTTSLSSPIISVNLEAEGTFGGRGSDLNTDPEDRVPTPIAT